MLGRSRWRIAVPFAVVIAGCTSTAESPIPCTTIAVWSLAITVRDATTARPVCDAVVLATKGETTHRLQLIGDGEACTYYGPQAMPGTFDVHASRAGYETTTIRGVYVGSDECHVIPVRLTLQLRPRI